MSDPPIDPEMLARAVAEVDAANARMEQRQHRPRYDWSEWLVNLPEYHGDGVAIEPMVVTAQAAYVDQLKAAYNPQRGDRSLEPGTYTRLTVDGVIWMSDTPAECTDLLDVDTAMSWAPGGSMLIVGLGLGVVLHRALVRGLRRIEVVERDARVIAAVGPHYRGMAELADTDLTIHCADVHRWRARRHSRWDVVWLDIWPNIDMEDLAEDARLRNRFRPVAGWVGAWGHAERLAQRKRIASGKWAY